MQSVGLTQPFTRRIPARFRLRAITNQTGYVQFTSAPGYTDRLQGDSSAIECNESERVNNGDDGPFKV